MDRTNELENEKLWQRHLAPWLGQRRVDRITTVDADHLVGNLETGMDPEANEPTRRRLSRNSVGNVMTLLRRMLKVAHRWEYIPKVPEFNASKHRSDRIEDDQWLTTEETQRLLAAADPEWRPLLVVAFRAGLRLGELGGLQRRDVDLAQGRLHLRRQWCEKTKQYRKPKHGKSRTVPLAHDARAALVGMSNGKATEPLFPQARPSRALERAMTAAATEAGIAKPMHPHMTRHRWASHCIQAGIPTRVVMSWGGWTSEAMLARYAHLSPEAIDHYMDRLAPKAGPLGIVPDTAEKAV